MDGGPMNNYDVIHITRCKNCVHYQQSNGTTTPMMVCTYDKANVVRHAYDYCSKAESKFQGEPECND